MQKYRQIDRQIEREREKDKIIDHTHTCQRIERESERKGEGQRWIDIQIDRFFRFRLFRRTWIITCKN